MNITVINTKLLIVHVQKINTWTLKKNDGLSLEDKFPFQPTGNFGVHVFRSCNHSTLSFSTWSRFLDASKWW